MFFFILFFFLCVLSALCVSIFKPWTAKSAKNAKAAKKEEEEEKEKVRIKQKTGCHLQAARVGTLVWISGEFFAGPPPLPAGNARA
jgi:hypothetical protein